MMHWTGLLRSSRRAASLAKGAIAMAATAGRASASTAGKLYRSASAASAANASGLGAAAAAAAVFAAGPVVFAGSDERSFIMIKPDGVQRGLVAAIISRFESKGYKLVGIKVIVPTEELASRHYDEHNGRPFFPKLVSFLSSGAVIAMVWEGTDVVKYGRTMIGSTNPLASPPGTIRGDYGIDVGRNIIHGSDSVESAQREIALWFSPPELAEYEATHEKWIYE